VCGDYITVPLSSVINKSISQATFPHTLKNVFVIPIYKSGPKSDPNNYRSILPTISKIIKRHVATQLFDNYLKQHNLLYAGFREYYSCCTALLKLIDSWLTDIDNGKCIGAIFLDLKKSF